MRVVVVGAGYAGIACMARLPAALPGSERHLVSPDPWHLHRTRLHEAVRRPLEALREPLPGLAPCPIGRSTRPHRIASRPR